VAQQQAAPCSTQEKRTICKESSTNSSSMPMMLPGKAKGRMAATALPASRQAMMTRKSRR
jgi:hypothetical protein